MEILILLAGLALFLGPVAFFMILGTRSRLEALSQQLNSLENNY